MNINSLIQLINTALDTARAPVNSVAAYLLAMTTQMRPGVSKVKITSEIIADNGNLGIMTGQMPDGTENVVNEFVYNVVEKVVDSLKDDALVECVIPAGSIIVQATGANAGGPVEAVGTNINNAKGYGVIR